MTFPVWVPIGPWRLHPHLVMEMLAYATGFWLYRRFRRQGDVLEPSQRLTTLAAAVVGAAVGSKLLAWLEDPAETLRLWSGGGAALFQGKSIVGGLLGGVVATEAVKKSLGI
ncbi:MAG TPA: prolipoprotein diacylglyceryl transferase family protein, partial [Planctomycetota bacterium]|nr:prolipoprotein diacylglyceryl transferase family protein [Planctomycetota bacterium]